ncbi:thiamine-phosphate diphosphorylase [Sphingomonas laterariae]|uniref:Thiamine-phosphate diphosphorylase n=2 Tax=Edaphosphingomonas laterariae TaxID=861865 RepID=A0A239GTD1_9SPHN|nr:thiamine-phosphate diphosphorylase [Sphingomonas laterariae]
MIHRQPCPRLWVMTDPRMGETLWDILADVPRGSGVVFRHYGVPDRRAIFERVRRIARARRLVLVLAGPPALAIRWKANGAHGPSPHRHSPRPLLRTAPAHNARELARATGKHAVFVSPVFATRSHPGARPLGPVRFGLLAQKARLPVIALGGMNARNAGRSRRFGAMGWAAIDGLTPRRKAIRT